MDSPTDKSHDGSGGVHGRCCHDGPACVWILGEADNQVRKAGLGIAVEDANRRQAPEWTAPANTPWDYTIFEREVEIPEATGGVVPDQSSGRRNRRARQKQVEVDFMADNRGLTLFTATSNRTWITGSR